MTNYSTFGFIETLRPEKHGLVTRLIDPISGATFCWLTQIGPIAIMKINGWMGEEMTVVKIFDKEWSW